MSRIIIFILLIVLAAIPFFIYTAEDNIQFTKNAYICNEPISINYTSSIYSTMKLYSLDQYGVPLWEAGAHGTGEMIIPGQTISGKYIIELHNENGNRMDEMIVLRCGVMFS